MLGLDVLSDLIVFSKYARYMPSFNRREDWQEAVQRSERMHIGKFPKFTPEILKAFGYVRDKQVLPSMRSLQFAGPAVLKSNSRSLNCSYLPVNHPKAFCETMFLLLGGSGVGYSVQQHHVRQLPVVVGPQVHDQRWLVGDSIEGWADAVRVLFKAYFTGQRNPRFDFSDIRAKGTLLKTAGGKAPGPEPLRKCLENLRRILDECVGRKLRPIDCHDMICYIADAVLAGGIRRSATISLFSLDDEDMLNCKSGNWWDTHPHRGRANNSATLLRNRLKRRDFDLLWERMHNSRAGEPGLYMSGNPEYGCNPCGEASLRPFTFCNLTSINMANVTSQEDFEARCRAAAIIGTLQAAYTDFHYLRPVWQQNTEHDALLGVSMTGVACDAFDNLDLTRGAKMVTEANAWMAAELGINPAARTTLMKPEGCQVKETITVTDKGILSLEELGDVKGERWQPSNFTVCTDNEDQRVTSFFVNGPAHTKKIVTSGGITLEATRAHKFRVLRGEEYVWIKAEDLEVGDLLPYRVGGYSGGTTQKLQTIDFPPVKYASNLRPIKQPTELNVELAWFLGLYFGDGSNHAKGIRVSGHLAQQKGFESARRIALEQFGIAATFSQNDPGTNKCQLCFNSTQLLEFLRANNLLKQQSRHIEIPLLIRKSPKEVIESFIEGYKTADGCTKNIMPSYCTTSKRWAEQLVAVLRAIGRDAKMREMPPTESSWGTGMRYWVSERMGRTSGRKYSWQEVWQKLDSFGKNLHFDKVLRVEDSFASTYDLAVEHEDHTYVSNSYISHNTGSLVAKASSGVHQWFAEHYLRRVRMRKNEAAYEYLAAKIPEFVEDDLEDPTNQACIVLPVKAPDGARTRANEDTDQLLARIARIRKEWILPGHRRGDNPHNVSATVHVQDHEWEDVKSWVWDNRQDVGGITFFPYDGGTYKQAPHEEIDAETYSKLAERLGEVDFTEIVESQDETDLQGEAACAGGACEVK